MITLLNWIRPMLCIRPAGHPKICTESVLKIMDAGYCLYVHIFMKNIISLKSINFYNSNQFMPDLRFQQSRRDN